MPCKPMHGTMQARPAASAKLTLTVASETGQPPTAAFTAILLAVRSVQQPPLSYALHFCGFINCRCDSLFGQASSKYIGHTQQVCWEIVACAPSMLKVEMFFHLFLKLMFLFSHPKLFLKILVPKLSSHVFFKLCLTKPDNIEGARFFRILS